jgi:nucleoside-diphosphate-sugar epimerase
VRRVLLTGAAGRIATAVRPVLRELAAEVVLTNRVDVIALEPGEGLQAGSANVNGSIERYGSERAGKVERAVTRPGARR